MISEDEAVTSRSDGEGVGRVDDLPTWRVSPASVWVRRITQVPEDFRRAPLRADGRSNA